LQKSIAGISFIGGDVPGFYGDPLRNGPKTILVDEIVYTTETGEPLIEGRTIKVEKPNWDGKLLKAWYRLGAFMPFFRAHGHLDSFKREPWHFPEDVLNNVRETIQLRYKLLFYLYT